MRAEPMTASCSASVFRSSRSSCLNLFSFSAYSARRTVKQPAVKQPKAHEGIAGIAARVGPERAGAILRSSQVAMAFEALGDRWSALMLREIFLGARRFEELVAATGANRATLTSRLRSLVD